MKLLTTSLILFLSYVSVANAFSYVPIATQHENFGNVIGPSVDSSDSVYFTDGSKIYSKTADGQLRIHFDAAASGTVGVVVSFPMASDTGQISFLGFELPDKFGLFQVESSGSLSQLGPLTQPPAELINDIYPSNNGSVAFTIGNIQTFTTTMYKNSELLVQTSQSNPPPQPSPGFHQLRAPVLLDDGNIFFLGEAQNSSGDFKGGLFKGPNFNTDLIIPRLKTDSMIAFADKIAFIGHVAPEFGTDPNNDSLYLTDESGTLTQVVPVPDPATFGSLGDFDNNRIYLNRNGGVSYISLDDKSVHDLVQPGQCIGGRTVSSANVLLHSTGSGILPVINAKFANGDELVPFNGIYRVEEGEPTFPTPLAKITMEDGPYVADNSYIVNAEESADSEGNALDYLWEIVEKPSGSNAQFFDEVGDGDSKIRIKPNIFFDIPGTYKIRLTVRNCGDENIAEKTIEVVSGNRPPVPSASPGLIFITDGEQKSIEISPNDPDEGQHHTYEISRQATKGLATAFSNGVVSYIPNVSSNGSDSFQVKVTDDGDPNLSGTVDITIIFSGGLPDGNEIKIELDESLAKIKQKQVPERCQIWGSGQRQSSIVKASGDLCKDVGLEFTKTFASHGCPLAATAVDLGQLGLKTFADGTPMSMSGLYERMTNKQAKMNNIVGMYGDSFNFNAAKKVFNNEMKTKLDICKNTPGETNCSDRFDKHIQYRVVVDNKDAVLDQHLASGVPVILEVDSPTHLNDPKAQHFVVAIGKRKNPNGSESILIHEVGSVNRKSLDDEPYKGKFRNLRLFELENKKRILATNFDRLRVISSDEIDLMVVDPAGNRTGVDFSTNQELNEIQNSAYYTEYVTSDDGDEQFPDTDNTRAVEIFSQALSGNYTIFAKATKSGCGRIRIEGYTSDDELNDVQELPICFSQGETKEVTINANAIPISGRSLTVSKFIADNSKFANQLTFEGRLETDSLIIGENQRITFGFSGGKLVETYDSGEFIEDSDKYELHGRVGELVSSFELFKDGRFRINFSNLKGIDVDRRFRNQVIALLIGKDAYLGFVKEVPHASTSILRLESDKNTYSAGERAKITVHLNVLPEGDSEFDLNGFFNFSPVKMQRLSEKTFMFVTPKVLTGDNDFKAQIMRFPKSTMAKLVSELGSLEAEKLGLQDQIRREKDPKARQQLELRLESVSSRIGSLEGVISNMRNPLGEPVNKTFEVTN